VGGVNTTSNSLLTTAASDATGASTTLAGLTPNQTLGIISTSTTISATVPGQNVVNVTAITLGNGTTLTLSGSATQSFVINVTGRTNVTFDNISLVGGLTPANVIFNVENGDTITDNSPGTLNGILMDINGSVSLTNNDTLNGEIISGNAINLSNNSDVEVVPTVPEASTTAYFTLGPLSLVAVMLLYRRFSRRKQTIVHDSHGRKQLQPRAGWTEPVAPSRHQFSVAEHKASFDRLQGPKKVEATHQEGFICVGGFFNPLF
jgi:hypothetical protein